MEASGISLVNETTLTIIRNYCNLVRREIGKEQRVKVPQQKRNSKPYWPRVMRRASRGARRSVDRGACRPAMEPRKQ